MNKRKTSAVNGVELSKILGLHTSAAGEWDVRSKLLVKLQQLITKEGLTHAQVARKARTSRTRITSILNGNLRHVSTDLLIRILGALGYQVNLTITKSNLAA